MDADSIKARQRGGYAAARACRVSDSGVSGLIRVHPWLLRVLRYLFVASGAGYGIPPNRSTSLKNFSNSWLVISRVQSARQSG